MRIGAIGAPKATADGVIGVEDDCKISSSQPETSRDETLDLDVRFDIVDLGRTNRQTWRGIAEARVEAEQLQGAPTEDRERFQVR